MNTQHTVEMLRKLRLHGMADRYYECTQLPVTKQIDAHTLVAMLTEAQAEYKQKRRNENLLKKASLRFLAYPEDVECSTDRGLSAEQWLLLCEGKYYENAQSILLTGPTGSGKTHIACALGYKACQRGNTVRYLKLSQFAETIKRSKVEGNYLKLISQLASVSLLILDDWGFDSLDKELSLCLYEILDERYAQHPTIITSQYPVTNWYDLITDTTLCEAILDRIINNAIQLNLKGESRRRKKSSK